MKYGEFNAYMRKKDKRTAMKTLNHRTDPYSFFMSSVIVAVGLAVTICRADTSASLRTTSLGDGWFEYRFHIQYNAFFDVFDSVSWDVPFEGFQEFGSTDGASEVELSDSRFLVKWLGDQPRETDRVVTVRSDSSLVGYSDINLCFLAVPSGWGGGGGIISGNIAGYIRFHGLAPCLTGDPDLVGASTYTNVVMMPDPQITDCTANSLSWNWSSGATMRIDASLDLLGWSPVTQVVNTAAVNTWVSPEPLNTYGNAFRVNLVSNKVGPAMGLYGAVKRRVTTAPAILPSGIEPQMDGRIGIRFPSQPGYAYRVCVWDVEGRLISQKNVVGDGDQSLAEVFDQGEPGIRWITIDFLGIRN